MTVRIEAQIEPIDPLSWLDAQTETSKVYWHDRDDNFEMAGVGISDEIFLRPGQSASNFFSALKGKLRGENKNLRYYGGLTFHDFGGSHKWRFFHRARFVLPMFEIYRTGKDVFLACNFSPDKNMLDETLRRLEILKFPKTNPQAQKIMPVNRVDFPGKTQWRENILDMLRRFQTTDLQKIVLARKSEFIFEQTLSPIDLLKNLKAVSPGAFKFCLQPNKNCAFVGASPERLYRRENSLIKSEAVAGTRPRGRNAAEDAKLETELLDSEKDRREHKFVLDALKENLKTCCDTVDVDDQISVLKLGNVQHLNCRLQGVLHEHIQDGDILSILHPTPAVGGSPAARARELIPTIEPFDRGLYAAPIGWIGKDAAEFVVGIRSGLVEKNKLSLYAGAGIVAGSDPDAEWREIENKMAGFAKATMAL